MGRSYRHTDQDTYRHRLKQKYSYTPVADVAAALVSVFPALDPGYLSYLGKMSSRMFSELWYLLGAEVLVLLELVYVLLMIPFKYKLGS